MVTSVTPMVCITLAFWLGRSGLICSGGCCADTYGTAHVRANRIAKVKRKNRFREIMVALLVVEFAALCNAIRGCARPERVFTPEFTTFYKCTARAGKNLRGHGLRAQ